MGAYSSRRMVDEVESLSHSGSEDDSDLEIDYAAILRSLISSGQVRMTASDYEFSYGPPKKIRHKPNTSTLDASEFAQMTRQACGLAPTKRKHVGKNFATMLSNRERGLCVYHNFSYANKCRLTNQFLPNKRSPLDNYNGKVFCGTFSKDGKYFITGSQDKQIRLYHSGDGSYKLFNKIHARDFGWSILDVAFSPDNEHFVYSSWSSSLHLCSVHGDSEQQIPLCLINTGRRFCIFSVMFSADGTEILGGANDGCLYVYDRQRNERSLKIPAHEYDINSVAFADQTSHIIYSGGDDGLVKVWDRRTLSEAVPKPVGVLAGHMDGITFIDSRGDGRHLISNSKDQSIKLWDIRVFSDDNAAKNTLKAVHEQTWDYRWQEVPKKLYNAKHKVDGDTSIMTYRGHIVIKTLIRCRFSPAETTGQRYIYTGCGVGRVVVYDALTGKMKPDLNGHSSCVRDVAWHPYNNEILSSSWDGFIHRWYYADNAESEEEDYETVLEDNAERPKALRRSARIAIAQKRKREKTNLPNLD